MSHVSQAGRYRTDPKTGETTLIERTEPVPPRAEPRKPGEPVHVPATAPETTEAPPDKSAKTKAKE